MLSTKTLPFFALLFAAFTGACAPQTETVKLFEDTTAARDNYTRLLVINVASDSELRRGFENDIVSRLKRAGADAIPSYTVLQNNDGLLQDDIERVADRSGADGILIAHMVSLETELDIAEGREDIVRQLRIDGLI